jgi:hypothetical protein
LAVSIFTTVSSRHSSQLDLVFSALISGNSLAKQSEQRLWEQSIPFVLLKKSSRQYHCPEPDSPGGSVRIFFAVAANRQNILVQGFFAYQVFFGETALHSKEQLIDIAWFVHEIVGTETQSLNR